MAIWNRLPAEILEIIFRSAAYTTDLYEFALVCKAWVQPAQAILYSNVCVYTFSQLEEFRDSVKCNPHLGTAVRSFSFSDDISEVELIKLKEEVLPTVFQHLPVLEKLDEFSLYSYSPVLDALENSQLIRLKSLIEPEPDSESDHVLTYFSCVLLMKKRLEHLRLSNNYHYMDKESLFDRLYNALHLFDNLTTINIEICTNEEIEVLEHIVESCKSLKDITFGFIPSDADAPLNSNITIDAILKSAPGPNIKLLTDNLNKLFNKKTLVYIMHKFSGLHSFNFCAQQHLTVSHLLDYQTIIHLLQYLSKIKEFRLSGLRADENIIAESFIPFFQMTLQHHLEIYYTKTDHAGTFDITKSEQTITITLFFTMNSGWKHFEFLEENGKFIRSMQFTVDLSVAVDVSSTLPNNFMAHIVTYCPNLENIWLSNCIFQDTIIPAFDFNKKTVLDKLTLDRCEYGVGVLELWSRMFSEVKSLNFTVRLIPYEIILPQTIIHSITLEVYACKIFLKLFVSSNSSDYYFMFDGSKNEVETTSEKVYLNAKKNGEQVYDVCCQTKPILNFVLW